MSTLIVNNEGWGKSSHSGNGGNCIEVMRVGSHNDAQAA